MDSVKTLRFQNQRESDMEIKSIPSEEANRFFEEIEPDCLNVTLPEGLECEVCFHFARGREGFNGFIFKKDNITVDSTDYWTIRMFTEMFRWIDDVGCRSGYLLVTPKHYSGPSLCLDDVESYVA
jgi:hypothetical protein